MLKKEQIMQDIVDLEEQLVQVNEALLLLETCSRLYPEVIKQTLLDYHLDLYHEFLILESRLDQMQVVEDILSYKNKGEEE